MSKHVVAAVDELPPGSRKLVTVKGRPIAIFNVEGELFALFNRCPHQGGSLCSGKLVGLVQSEMPGDYRYSARNDTLRCPWHGWEFNLKTGRSRCRPNMVRTRTFKVGIESGEEFIDTPYVAETFPIHVEESYIVIEMTA